MQNDDRELRTFLKAALPPMRGERPSRDVWPLVARRTSTRTTWSLADWTAAATIGGGLLLFPKWFWFLAYHL